MTFVKQITKTFLPHQPRCSLLPLVLCPLTSSHPPLSVVVPLRPDRQLPLIIRTHKPNECLISLKPNVHAQVECRLNRWLGQRYRQWDTVGFSTSAAVLLLGSFHSWSVDNIAHTAISLISGLAFVLLLAVQHLRPDLFLNLRQYALAAL